MSWYAAVHLLRGRAEHLRSRDHGVTPQQIESARAAMRIFSTPVIDAMLALDVAAALDDLADVLQQRGRDEETPDPTARRP